MRRDQLKERFYFGRFDCRQRKAVQYSPEAPRTSSDMRIKGTIVIVVTGVCASHAFNVSAGYYYPTTATLFRDDVPVSDTPSPPLMSAQCTYCQLCIWCLRCARLEILAYVLARPQTS